MSSKRLSLRFNLNNPGDLAAWEYLHRLDGDSINKEIISMINASKQNNDLRELLRQTITVAMQGMALQPVEKKAEISENDLAALDFINAFTAYCVSYVLCSRYNVPKDMFRFDRLPEGFSTMDARSVRNELSKIRDVANEISSDMAKVLDKSMKPKERRDEAR